MNGETMRADVPIAIDGTQALLSLESRAAPGLLRTDDHVAQEFRVPKKGSDITAHAVLRRDAPLAP